MHKDNFANTGEQKTGRNEILCTGELVLWESEEIGAKEEMGNKKKEQSEKQKSQKFHYIRHVENQTEF